MGFFKDFISGWREGRAEFNGYKKNVERHSYNYLRETLGKPYKTVACGDLESNAIAFVNLCRSRGWIISDPYWSRLSDEYYAGVWSQGPKGADDL